MELTRPQRELLQRLKRLIATKNGSIRRGVTWYIWYESTSSGKTRMVGDFIDSRICNALERKGVLVPRGDTTYDIKES